VIHVIGGKVLARGFSDHGDVGDHPITAILPNPRASALIRGKSWFLCSSKSAFIRFHQRHLR
jgi:hypothetical protein